MEDEDHFKDQPVRTTSSYAQSTPFVKAEIKTQFNALECETETEQHLDEREILAKDKEAFYAYIADIPNVIECDCITGDYSMLLKVYFSDTVVLDRFITDLQFYGDTKTHIVFSTNVGPRGLQVPVDDQ